MFVISIWDDILGYLRYAFSEYNRTLIFAAKYCLVLSPYQELKILEYGRFHNQPFNRRIFTSMFQVI